MSDVVSECVTGLVLERLAPLKIIICASYIYQIGPLEGISSKKKYALKL